MMTGGSTLTQLISGRLAAAAICSKRTGLGSAGRLSGSAAPAGSASATEMITMEDTVRTSPDPEHLAAAADEVLRGPDDLLGKVDELVQPAAEPENQVLVDDARIVRWTGPLFALFSLILLPWTVYLGASLPSRLESPHYDVAWTGFDVILLAVLAATALLRAAQVPLSGHLGCRDGHAAGRRCVVRRHDHPSESGGRVDRACRRGGVAAGRRVPVALPPHRAAGRAQDHVAAGSPAAGTSCALRVAGTLAVAADESLADPGSRPDGCARSGGSRNTSMPGCAVIVSCLVSPMSSPSSSHGCGLSTSRWSSLN